MNNNKTKSLIQTKFNITQQHSYKKNNNNNNKLENHVHDFTKSHMDSIQNFYIKDKNSDIDGNNKTKTKTTLTKDNFDYYGDQLVDKVIKPNMKNKKLHICVYHIIIDHIKPFVKFLLYKDIDKDNNLLYLPTVDVFNIVDTVKKFKDIFKETTNADIKYKGCIENGNDAYLILEYSTKNPYLQETELTKNNSKWWWALSTEIINYKKLLNFDIDYSVTHFFLNNIKLLFVYDEKGNPYECPSVCYYGSYYKNIESTIVLGVCRETLTASFGPYYYFGTYEQGIRHALYTPLRKPMTVNGKLITVDENGRYEKGGLMRLALFVGKQKILLGRKEDPVDESKISVEAAKQNDFIKATMKFRDVGGKWVDENYDSITYGKHDIKVDNKLVRTINSLVVVKSHEQQIPLSYCYV